MIYEELKIQLDLNEPIDVLRSIGKQTEDKYWFVVCDEGDCHLFNKNGNEIDISKIKILYEYLIPKDIKKIIVPDSIESIEYETFYGCINLTSANIPDSVKNIGDDAFYACESLASINIPDSVEYIGDTVFKWCIDLKSITIPTSVKNIGNLTFADCKNLKSLTFKDKTIDQVKSMEYYPWGIENKSIIKCI